MLCLSWHRLDEEDFPSLIWVNKDCSGQTQFLCFESWTEHFSNFRLQLHLGKQEGHLDDGIRDERRTAIHGSSWFEKKSRLDAIR